MKVNVPIVGLGTNKKRGIMLQKIYVKQEHVIKNTLFKIKLNRIIVFFIFSFSMNC